MIMCAQGQEQQFRLHPAKSSTKYSPQHTPISHLWIAWTYSDSLCCCAFRVTPIAVSRTDRAVGKTERRLWGSGTLKLKEISAVPNKTPKPVPALLNDGRHKLSRKRSHVGGPCSLYLACVCVVVASVNIFRITFQRNHPVN